MNGDNNTVVVFPYASQTATLSGSTITLPAGSDLSSYAVGEVVTGRYIQPGTTIVGFPTGGSSITLSAAITRCRPGASQSLNRFSSVGPPIAATFRTSRTRGRHGSGDDTVTVNLGQVDFGTSGNRPHGVLVACGSGANDTIDDSQSPHATVTLLGGSGSDKIIIPPTANQNSQYIGGTGGTALEIESPANATNALTLTGGVLTVDGQTVSDFTGDLGKP